MICADPNDTMPLVLRSAMKLPPETRPTFFVRFLTDIEYRRLRKLLAQCLEEKDEAKAADLIEQAIRIGVVDCKNIKFRGAPLAFAEIERFGALLCCHELSELAYGQIKVITMGENDRFFSESQPDSAPEPSAPDAKADVAK